MRLCAISDMHGQLGFNVDECDVLAICGDIVPLDIQWSMTKSYEWLNDTFIRWCMEQPCEKVIFIAGNHDAIFERKGALVSSLFDGVDKLQYLMCSSCEYDGKRFFGTPYCSIFGRWAFMTPYKEQDEIYAHAISDIGDKKIDVILSHDAPYGVSDVLLEDCPWRSDEHIGNKSLERLCTSLSPSLLLHGHLHSTSHECEKLNDTSVYNVSLLSENYKMVYKPLYLDL